jgi:tellurite resistance protein
MVTGGITRTDHAREVLRVAALLAHVSGGVSPAERALLEKLAQAIGLDTGATDTALAEVSTALSK